MKTWPILSAYQTYQFHKFAKDSLVGGDKGEKDGKESKDELTILHVVGSDMASKKKH